MTRLYEAIALYYPNAEYTMEETYESLQWFSKDKPKPTLEQLEELLPLVENAKAQQAAEAAAKRQALLDKLGITEDEARLLLGGN
jgi:hypothetical protein